MNSNGILSFRSPFTDFSPDPFPLIFQNNILIAPFWDDFNVNNGGQISFRLSDDQTLLNRVSSRVNAAFNTGFSAEFLLIATWNGVPEFGSSNAVMVNLCVPLLLWPSLINRHSMHQTITASYRNNNQWRIQRGDLTTPAMDILLATKIL